MFSWQLFRGKQSGELPLQRAFLSSWPSGWLSGSRDHYSPVSSCSKWVGSSPKPRKRRLLLQNFA